MARHEIDLAELAEYLERELGRDVALKGLNRLLQLEPSARADAIRHAIEAERDAPVPAAVPETRFARCPRLARRVAADQEE